MIKILLKPIMHWSFFFYHPRVQFFLRIFMTLILIGVCQHADAQQAGGTDLLQGTDTSFWATVNGTGKKYIYGVEGIVAIASYIKSKNLMAFLGIIGIAVFLNIVLTMAGGTT